MEVFHTLFLFIFQLYFVWPLFSQSLLHNLPESAHLLLVLATYRLTFFKSLSWVLSSNFCRTKITWMHRKHLKGNTSKSKLIFIITLSCFPVAVLLIIPPKGISWIYHFFVIQYFNFVAHLDLPNYIVSSQVIILDVLAPTYILPLLLLYYILIVCSDVCLSIYSKCLKGRNFIFLSLKPSLGWAWIIVSSKRDFLICD